LFIQQLFNGIMLGTTYALIAISFTLLMGILNMLNFAIGEVFMLGAIFGLAFVNLGLSIYVAFPLAMICTGCVCLVIERFSFRPLRNAPPLVPLLSTIGFSILFQNTAENIWGTERSQFPQWMEPVDFHLGPVLISSTQLIILAAAIFFMVGLDLFIQRTRIGRGMRAVSENIETANILGVDSTLIISTAFFFSGALAGASGILFGLSFSIVSPFMGRGHDRGRYGKYKGSHRRWNAYRHRRGPQRRILWGLGQGFCCVRGIVSRPCNPPTGDSRNNSD